MMMTPYLHLSLACYFLASLSFLLQKIFKGRFFNVLSTSFFSLGVFVNALVLGFRWLNLGHPPFTSLYEVLVLFSLFSGCIAWVNDFGGRTCFPLSGISAVFCLILLCAASLLDADFKPLLPSLKSKWLVLHVLSYCLAYSLGFASFLAGSVSLLGSLLRKKIPMKSRDQANRAGHLLVSLLFPFLTLGLTTGSIWASEAWGRYWAWDPKETWALITWLIYLLYLHLPDTKEEGVSSFLLILGFASMLFTLLGASFLLPGIHSYR